MLAVFLIMFFGNAEKDYYTIFPERDPTKSNHELKKDKDDDDEIYEVGTDGTIDISS